MLASFLNFQKNWEILRAETDLVGLEVESWSYDQLNQPTEDQRPIKRKLNGCVVEFQVACYEILPNGDLGLCVDAIGGPPTLFGLKPSYRFFKRSDNSVYY